jgi:hypothetical protein
LSMLLTGNLYKLQVKIEGKIQSFFRHSPAAAVAGAAAPDSPNASASTS